ncbi:MFS transporter, partial [Streptomyces palmae]
MILFLASRPVVRRPADGGRPRGLRLVAGGRAPGGQVAGGRAAGARTTDSRVADGAEAGRPVAGGAGDPGPAGAEEGTAGPRRRGPRSVFGPYRRIFAAPGTLAFTVAGFAARLPGSMLGVSMVLMIALSRGSYALAGAVSATGVAATAIASPLLGRLVDRYGQARVSVPAVGVFATGVTAMLLCVHYGAPSWTLFCCTIGSSAVPSMGSMTRARWTVIYQDDEAARHTAGSFEQVVDEVCFMLGPALAMVLCTTLFPEAGLLVGVILMVTGVLAFTAQRATEPRPHRTEPHQAPARPPLRIPELRTVLVTFLATGAVFGSMEVATVATVESYGAGSASSVVLAVQASGSCLAGLVFGALPARG